MLRAKRGLMVLVVLATLAVGTLAIASGDRRPDTDSVMATIVFDRVVGKERFCEGVDGEYAEQYVRVSGTATGDSRLSGDVEFSVYVLVNIENGVGIEDGTIRIRDPRTGRTKVKARVKDAGTAEIWQGLLFGEGRDRGLGPAEETFGAGSIHANYRTTFHPNGAVVMQVGGEAADGRIPGVVFSGKCRGKFERFEGDIPPPAATSTRTRAVAPKAGWNR
jgi:hypothetical protein